MAQLLVNPVTGMPIVTPPDITGVTTPTPKPEESPFMIRMFPNLSEVLGKYYEASSPIIPWGDAAQREQIGTYLQGEALKAKARAAGARGMTPLQLSQNEQEAAKQRAAFASKSAEIKKQLAEKKAAEAPKKEEAKPIPTPVPSADDFLSNQVAIAAEAQDRPKYQAYVRNGKMVFVNTPDSTFIKDAKPIDINVASEQLRQAARESGRTGTLTSTIGGMAVPQQVPMPTGPGYIGYFAPGPGMDVTQEMQGRLALDQELRARALEAQQRAQDILNPPAAAQRKAGEVEAISTAKEMGPYGAMAKVRSPEMMKKDAIYTDSVNRLNAGFEAAKAAAALEPNPAAREKHLQDARAAYEAGMRQAFTDYMQSMQIAGAGRFPTQTFGG